MACTFSHGKLKDTADGLLQTRKNSQKFNSFSALNESLEKNIRDTVSKLYQPAINNIADFLTSDNRGLIRVAVIHCQFSESSRVKSELVDRLKEIGSQKVVHNISASTNFVKLMNELENEGDSLLVINQCESLNSEFMNRLMRILIFSEQQPTILACVSTDISAFVSLCSLDILSRLKAQSFRMPAAEIVLDDVLKCIISGSWSEQENIPLQLSGEILNIVRTRFSTGSHSVEDIQTFISFCLLNHFMNGKLEESNMESKSETFSKEMNVCRAVFSLICTYMDLNDKNSLLFHEFIQTKSNFKEFSRYRQWIQNSSSIDWEQMVKDLKISSADTSRLEIAIKEYQDAQKSERPALPKKETEKTPSRMTAMDLKRLHEEQRIARLGGLQNSKRAAIVSAFEEMLSHYLRDWRTLQFADSFVVDACPTEFIYTDSSRFDEEALMNKKHAAHPISIAYKTLLNRNSWKTISLSDWGTNFEQQIDRKLQPNARPAFFAALGQLELMGILKSNDLCKGSATVLHYPVTATI